MTVFSSNMTPVALNESEQSAVETQMIDSTIELISGLTPKNSNRPRNGFDSPEDECLAQLDTEFQKRYPLVDFRDERMIRVIRATLESGAYAILPIGGVAAGAAFAFLAKSLKDSVLGIYPQLTKKDAEETSSKQEYTSLPKLIKFLYTLKLLISNRSDQRYSDVKVADINRAHAVEWRVFEEDQKYMQFYAQHPVKGVLDRAIVPLLPLIPCIATLILLPKSQAQITEKARAYIVDRDDAALDALIAFRKQRAWGFAALAATITTSIPALAGVINTLLMQYATSPKK